MLQTYSLLSTVQLSLYLHYLLFLKPLEVVIIIPILQIQKLRHRVVKYLPKVTQLVEALRRNPQELSYLRMERVGVREASQGKDFSTEI